MYMVVDKETGQVVADNILLFGKPKKSFDRGFVKFFTAFFDSVMENDRIAGKAIRLLFYMIANLDFDTYIVRIIPQYAVKELNISRDTFYRWVQDLEEEGFIKKIDRYTYQITPYIAVKGDSAKAMENLINETENINKTIRTNKKEQIEKLKRMIKEYLEHKDEME